jgi:hypothetical protein
MGRWAQTRGGMGAPRAWCSSTSAR